MNINYRSIFSGAVFVLTLGLFSDAVLAVDKPAGDQFPVNLSVQSACTFTTPASMDFGTRSGVTYQVYPSKDGTKFKNVGSTQYMSSTLQVQCTKGASYKVTFDSYFGSGVTSPTGDAVRYLTLDGKRSGLGLGYYLRVDLPYGDTGTVTSLGYAFPETATGLPKSYTIYATIDNKHWSDFFNAYPAAGVYSDIVTVNVEAAQ